MQQEIGKEVEDKIAKTRRTAMLHEQLQVIKKELGLTKDDKEALVEKFTSRLASMKLPDAAKVLFTRVLLAFSLY